MFNILTPGAVLVLWPLIMLLWAGIAQFSATAKTRIAPSFNMVGQKKDLDSLLLANDAWKSNNYAHLMEQPTIFYPTLITLALTGEGFGINLILAWTYVGLRIIPSLHKATLNRVMPRFMIFAVSSVCLLIMAINALLACLKGGII